MEGSLNLKVQTISCENIKPTSPTPKHLKYLKLSLLDQLHSPDIIPVLLFYTANDADSTSSAFDITRLKTCLSQTLDSFYPLAGRLESSTIHYNDQGIPFIETRVSCPLSAVFKYTCSPYRFDLLGKFCPPMSLLLGETRVQVAIQINVFECGGVVVALYFNHKVMDGTAISTFLRHWAALSSQRSNDLAQVQPDFDVATRAFPPLPEEELLQKKSTPNVTEVDIEKNEKEVEPIVIKSFIFRSSAVANLKAKATSELVPNPSRFLALAGYLWQQIWLATSIKTRSAVSSAVTVAVNLRTCINSPFPKVSIGNLYDKTFVRAEHGAELHELVAEMYGSITKCKDIIAGCKGTDKVAEVVFERNREITGSESKENFYAIASWSKCSGFDDVDFGFGKPKWIVPIDGLHCDVRNLICLTDYADSDGDGFEAWLFLEEKTMEILESNQEFLSFCSPHF